MSLLENQARTPYSTFNRSFFLNEDGSVSKKKVDHLIKTLKRIKESSGSEIRLANLTITRHGIHTIHHYPEYIDDIIFLHKCGVLKLRETTLSKLTSYVPFSISDASSGEQSVVISVLGIASQIEDNSIICIDEPEICLHPEWQERYIKILTTTFSMYSGCHFIIATHSPQIVSNLDPVNSYILSLETGETTDAREYIKHSSDFQLVNVFNSPGFRNEYLSRIALNVFAKASKNKTFDDEDISNYNVLLSQRRLLSTDDPVYQLFNAINEMYQTYGRH